MQDAEFITTREAASIVHQEEGTLAQWRYLGTGPRYYKAGRKPLYKRSEVLAWLEQQVHTSTRDSAR